MTPAQVINMYFYDNPGYDLNKDFVPIGLVSSAPALLVANPKLGAKTVADVVRLAKSKPGQIPFGSAGAGLSTHLMMELLLKETGTKMIHVPYRGSAPALNGLIAGDVMLMIDSMVSSLPHVKSGALEAIAVSSAKRSPIAPEVPTIAESGVPGFDSITWYGLMAPAGTPPEIAAKLAREVQAVLDIPEVRKRFIDMGTEAGAPDPVSFGKFLEDEAVRWRAAIVSSGAKAGQ